MGTTNLATPMIFQIFLQMDLHFEPHRRMDLQHLQLQHPQHPELEDRRLATSEEAGSSPIPSAAAAAAPATPAFTSSSSAI